MTREFAKKHDRVSCVYLITNPLGHVYIGSTKDLCNRVLTYIRMNAQMQRVLYASLLKHGAQNHKIEILRKQEGDIKKVYEKKFIAQYVENGFNVMNIINNGTSEVRFKIANAKRYFHPQEAAILKHLLNGLTSKEIGQHMGLKKRAVDFIIKKLKDKHVCKSVLQLCMKMYVLGEIKAKQYNLPEH